RGHRERRNSGLLTCGTCGLVMERDVEQRSQHPPAVPCPARATHRGASAVYCATSAAINTFEHVLKGSYLHGRSQLHAHHVLHLVERIPRAPQSSAGATHSRAAHAAQRTESALHRRECCTYHWLPSWLVHLHPARGRQRGRESNHELG